VIRRGCRSSPDGESVKSALSAVECLSVVRGSGRLVGRDREVVRLRALVAELASGRGRSVWIEGEPGIGKSALLAVPRRPFRSSTRSG
jgi:transcriptional regulator with AAA-type ATPase domain